MGARFLNHGGETLAPLVTGISVTPHVKLFTAANEIAVLANEAD